MNHYIYLVKEREFIKTNENIYKIGKTTQEGLGRFKNYPIGSELILHLKCYDCHIAERDLLILFKNKYIQRRDIGSEYFEGNYVTMMSDMMNYVSESFPTDMNNIHIDYNRNSEDQKKIQQMKPGFKFIAEYIQNFFLNKPEWKTFSKDSSIFRFVAGDLNSKYKEINKDKKTDHGTLAKQLSLLEITSTPMRTYNGDSRGQQRCYTLYPPYVENAIRIAIGVETYKLNLELTKDGIDEQQNDLDIENVREKIKLAKILLDSEEQKLKEIIMKK